MQIGQGSLAMQEYIRESWAWRDSGTHESGSSGLVVPSKVDNIDGAKKSGFDVFCLIDCKLSTIATNVAYIKILGLAYQERSVTRQSHSLLFAPLRSTHSFKTRSALHTMSACSSTFSVSPSATPELVSTPATQSSLLSDDDVAADPLDIEGVSSSFIMVVGGLGYIGSHTVLELLKEGYNVLVIDDLSNSYENVLTRIKILAEEFCKTQGRRLPALHFQQLDYRSPQMKTVLASYSSYSVSSKPTSTLARRFPYSNLQRTDSGIEMETDDVPEPVIERRSRITGVIHFAAYKSVEESIRMPLRYYSNNVCGLVDFLGLIEEFGIKNFVFSSSATVYGEGANCGVPLREELCVHHPETFVDSEGQERRVLPGVLGLTSPYGRSKFMCESILADLAMADPTWSITALRYFNPVSPNCK
jgi:UDP-glucose 4-epimerase